MYALKIAALIAVFGCGLFAEPIVFTHSGVASGSVGAVSFTNAPFTITGRADTANRVGTAPVFSIDHDSASISIQGVGDFQFTTGTRTWLSNILVGLGRTAPQPWDLLEGPTTAIVGVLNWDMLSSIGPITGGGSEILQWDDSPAVMTDGGRLVLNDAFPVTLTFSAQLQSVPEPASWTMLIFAAGVALLKRRRT